MARLDHENIVTVFAAGFATDRLWIAMQLVRGSTLEAWAAEDGSLTTERFEQARKLIAQAGAALSSAHASGLVHRDFKPSNVLVGEDGRGRVTDFGLARMLQAAPSSPGGSIGAGAAESTEARTSAPAGTPRYMSPEQIRGLHVDPPKRPVQLRGDRLGARLRCHPPRRGEPWLATACHRVGSAGGATIRRRASVVRAGAASGAQSQPGGPVSQHGLTLGGAGPSPPAPTLDHCWPRRCSGVLRDRRMELGCPGRSAIANV